MPREPPATGHRRGNGAAAPDDQPTWTSSAEKELRKIPFFVRGKARRNTEKYAAETGSRMITMETLYDAKAHFSTLIALQVVLITLDRHVAGSVQRARADAGRRCPTSCTWTVHAAATGTPAGRPERLPRRHRQGDIIVVTMLFIEDHVKAAAGACCAPRSLRRHDLLHVRGEIMKLTAMGRFRWTAKQKGPIALLKRLRGKTEGKGSRTAGAQQIAVLRQLPKILRFIPGTAQDVRVYFISMQYWLAGSDENLANLICIWSIATPPASARPCAAQSSPAHRSSTRRQGTLHPAPRNKDFRALIKAICLARRTRSAPSACCSCAPTSWPATPATTTA
jgi:hypothetical protein